MSLVEEAPGLEEAPLTRQFELPKFPRPEARDHFGPTFGQRVRHALGITATGIKEGFPAAMLGVGTASVLAVQPASLDTGTPGLSAEAAIQMADYASFSYGPTIGYDAPGSYMPVVGADFSAKVTITELDTKAHGADPAQLAAALLNSDNPSNIQEAIETPIKSALIRRIGSSIGIGFGVFGLTAMAEKAWRRKRRRDRESADEEIEAIDKKIQLIEQVADDRLGDEDDLANKLLTAEKNNKENFVAKHTRREKVRNRVGSLLGLLAVGSGVVAPIATKAAITPPSVSRHYAADVTKGLPMVGQLAKQNPELWNHVFVTGDAGAGMRQLVQASETYMNRYDQGWKAYADYFAEVAVPSLDIPEELQNNPDIVRITVGTDFHDNQPEEKEFLGPALKALGTDLFLNIGDQESNGGHSFLDYGAWQRAANALPIDEATGKAIPEFLAPGNHDHDNYQEVNNVRLKDKYGRAYQPIIPLDKNNKYSQTFDGITVVGSPDLNSTGVNGTFPRGMEAQIANDSKQGEIIAEQACDTYKNTGKRPIVIAHEQWATYKAIINGCAAAAFSGHGHMQMPLKAYKNPDGSVTWQQTIGSASGDGPNNSINVYNLPTINGYMVTYLWSKSMNTPVGAIVTTIYPNKMPTAEYVDMQIEADAVSPLGDKEMRDFMEKYTPDSLEQLKLEEAQKTLLMTPH